ncbi:hypothetical protein ABRZ24_04905 [Brenneria populi]|uniref:Uncharacterized protein n=1 Tax=Brenneria populi TaxID=1505588 RepID=A0ABU6JNB0_9GAMM|nr:hypothetical protein [Brenneria populi Li et al. 2015]
MCRQRRRAVINGKNRVGAVGKDPDARPIKAVAYFLLFAIAQNARDASAVLRNDDTAVIHFRYADGQRPLDMNAELRRCIALRG